MIGPTNGELPYERDAVLAEILRTMPGIDSETQRNRMLTAMQRLSSVTSYEGSRFLDCYDPRARIYELRLAGYRVTTIMRAVPTESGVVHHVGVYVLEGPATYPLFDGLDDEQAAA
jgi:hypothetical protein